jgi:hypothetical protein
MDRGASGTPLQPPEEALMTLLPTRVSFRHLGHSDALEEDLRERTAVLEQYYAGIVVKAGNP